MAEGSWAETEPTTTRTVVTPLLAQDDLDQIIAKQLIPTLEWAGLTFQAGVLIVSAAVDPYGPVQRSIVLTLGLLHVAFINHYRKGGGPFARGGYWVLFPLAQSIVINFILAFLSAPNTFGWAASTPGCGYSNGFWLLAAAYPRPVDWPRRLRTCLELSALVLYAGFILALEIIVNLAFHPIFLRAAAVNLGWTIIGYVMGNRVTVSAVVQLNAKQRLSDEAMPNSLTSCTPTLRAV